MPRPFVKGRGFDIIKYMKKTTKITKEMTIGEITNKYPKTIPVFLNHGLHCFGCPAASQETLEEVVKLHQIDFEKFLKDLNKTAEK